MVERKRCVMADAVKSYEAFIFVDLFSIKGGPGDPQMEQVQQILLASRKAPALRFILTTAASVKEFDRRVTILTLRKNVDNEWVFTANHNGHMLKGTYNARAQTGSLHWT
jgi:hypothetical protein